jgi:hypothetical protein
LQILEVDNMLQSERKMRQELEMQHIQEKNELTALVNIHYLQRSKQA